MKLSKYDRAKIDVSDDKIFYNTPRFVNHLSNSFIVRLTNLYTHYLQEHHIILDLMSSWVSHLPKNKTYKKVIGHGMNESELITNKRLDRFWVQDLNKNQKMPLEDSYIDIGLIVAGWQYLQYPENVSLELSRIIKKDSLLIISFTNRAFWTKSPNIWSNSSEQERIEYVENILSVNGWSVEMIYNEKTFESKLFGLYSSESDPFYSVVARNNKSNYLTSIS